jgi:hypothetical protein
MLALLADSKANREMYQEEVRECREARLREQTSREHGQQTLVDILMHKAFGAAIDHTATIESLTVTNPTTPATTP